MNVFKGIWNGVCRAYRWQGFWWVAAMAGVLIVGGILSWQFWEDLRSKDESLSTAIRNVGLVIGGIEAMLLAAWRSTVAGRQADTALRQTETTQQGLLNERYQKGAEMLGSEVLAVRMAGIYALQRLAEEHLEQYHIQIMELFCAFVRFPTDDKMMDSSRIIEEQDERRQTLRPDVQDTMRFLGSRSQEGISLERRGGFKPYLRDANISNLQTADANLSRAWLTNANLSNAILIRIDLSDARLRRANLSNADLSGASLKNADLEGANLTGSSFSRGRSLATGLTQAQLDEARSDPENPPNLNGVRDAETGEQLDWRGKPLDADPQD